MVIKKRWVLPVYGVAGALLLSGCALKAEEASDPYPEKEVEALSEGDFENVMGLEKPEVAEIDTTTSDGPTVAARFYTVFFDLGADTLSEDGMGVVKEIADAWGSGVAKLKLVGHADLTGPKSYNQQLSERRAKAVRDALAELGIGAGRLLDGAAGETDLLVPTADGVSERNNRRVTVTVE